MPTLTFIGPNKHCHTVSAVEGDSVMRAAVFADVPGIVAECGGCATCATCHCYVDSERFKELPAASDDERAMLENLLLGKANSRLTCQILVTASMEGMRFEVPEWQG